MLSSMRGTATDRLGWALRFAQADLANWRDGDYLNAWDDVKTLVAGAGEAESLSALFGEEPVDRRKRLDPVLAREWLASLQRALRDLLERLLKERHEARRRPSMADGPDEPVKRVFWPVEIPFTGKAVLSAQPPFDRLQMIYAPKAASPVETFVTGTLLRVADLLTRVDLSRLRICPECKKLFLAVRRQRFDTAQCSLRDRVRRFREHQGQPRSRRKR